MNNNYTHPPTGMVFRGEGEKTELIYCTLESKMNKCMFRKGIFKMTNQEKKHPIYNSQLKRTFHFTYCEGLHILCQGAGHLKNSNEAEDTQEAQSVHSRG